MPRHGHRQSELRGLALHRAAFEKLRRRPELKEEVLDLVERWLEREELECSRPWIEEWRAMLTSWPFERMEGRVLDEIHGQQLRQCSPLAPVLSPSERWAILREVNTRGGEEAEIGEK